MTVLDDLNAMHAQLSADAQAVADGVAAIKEQVRDLLAAQAANPDDSAAVAAALSQLEADVAGVHTLAQGFVPTTSTAGSGSGTDSTGSSSPAPAPTSPASDSSAPAADPAPSGTLTTDVQTGPAAEPAPDTQATAVGDAPSA